MLFSEVALKTPDFLRLPGYAHIYLGKWGRKTAVITSIFGSIGTLLIYIIVGGEFLANLLMPFLNGDVFLYTLLYFVFGSFFIFRGIRAISKIEFLGLILLFFSLIFVFWQGLPFLKINNLFLFGNWKSEIGNYFLPYGPIIFALWGATMIPEIEEMLINDKKKIKRIVFIATLIPAIFYLFFIVFVAMISGSETTQEAIVGLKNILGKNITSIMFLAGFLATFTSFVTVGLTLKKVFWYDLKMPHYFSWVLTCSLPLLLYLLGVKDFIKVIGFVGGVMLAIEGVLILLMYEKLAMSGVEGVKQNKSKFLVYPLVSVFILGIIYEIIYFLK